MHNEQDLSTSNGQPVSNNAHNREGHVSASRIHDFTAKCVESREKVAAEMLRLQKQRIDVRVNMGITQEMMNSWKEEHQNMVFHQLPSSNH
jgi:hypothetical protein